MINDFELFLQTMKPSNLEILITVRCTRFPRSQISTLHACKISHLLPAWFKIMSNLLTSSKGLKLIDGRKEKRTDTLKLFCKFMIS